MEAHSSRGYSSENGSWQRTGREHIDSDEEAPEKNINTNLDQEELAIIMKMRKEKKSMAGYPPSELTGKETD